LTILTSGNSGKGCGQSKEKHHYRIHKVAAGFIVLCAGCQQGKGIKMHIGKENAK